MTRIITESSPRLAAIFDLDKIPRHGLTITHGRRCHLRLRCQIRVESVSSSSKTSEMAQWVSRFTEYYCALGTWDLIKELRGGPPDVVLEPEDNPDREDADTLIIELNWFDCRKTQCVTSRALQLFRSFLQSVEDSLPYGYESSAILWTKDCVPPAFDHPETSSVLTEIDSILEMGLAIEQSREKLFHLTTKLQCSQKHGRAAIELRNAMRGDQFAPEEWGHIKRRCIRGMGDDDKA